MWEEREKWSSKESAGKTGFFLTIFGCRSIPSSSFYASRFEMSFSFQGNSCWIPISSASCFPFSSNFSFEKREREKSIRCVIKPLVFLLILILSLSWIGDLICRESSIPWQSVLFLYLKYYHFLSQVFERKLRDRMKREQAEDGIFISLPPQKETRLKQFHLNECLLHSIVHFLRHLIPENLMCIIPYDLGDCIQEVNLLSSTSQGMKIKNLL